MDKPNIAQTLHGKWQVKWRKASKDFDTEREALAFVDAVFGRLVAPRIVYTRDAKIPLSDDDRDMEAGWDCIPIRPTLTGVG